MKFRQQGFTLVELIVVIVILGILAATALPRFINVQQQARGAVVQGIAGGLRSAVAVVQAGWQAQGGTGATVSMVGGVTVDVNNATGIPLNTTGGIGTAMQCESATACQGNVIDLSVTPSLWRPSSGGSATCQATYAPGNGTVTTDTSGC